MMRGWRLKGRSEVCIVHPPHPIPTPTSSTPIIPYITHAQSWFSNSTFEDLLQRAAVPDGTGIYSAEYTPHPEGEWESGGV